MRAFCACLGTAPVPRCQCRLKGSLLWRSAPTALRRTSAASLLMPDFGALTAAAPLLTPTPLRGILCRALPCPPGCGRCITLPFITAASWLCAGSALESVGSDLFTNCRALDRFILDAAPDAPTGLKKLVAAVSADIGAVFAPGGAVQAKVFYPEYFEFLDENTPAHIFNHSIEGEGYRYRQCFDGSVLRFAEYDAAFPQACVGESEKKLCRIALDRLCTPFALLPEAQGIYSAYLAAHAASAAAPLIARRDTESLQLVLKLADGESRRQIALACSQSGWSEGAALTLGGQRPRRQKTYDFDDL